MPIPSGRGKRVLRFFLFTLAGIFGLFVLLVIASRMATNEIFRGIEASRATGLSANMMDLELAQSPQLIRSADDLEIVRLASLSLETRDLDGARGRMESIVQGHQGHFDQLQVRTVEDSGRALTATLRVPAEEFDSTLGELRVLGSADQETQSSTSTSVDSDKLDAKLAAARVTENRLNRLLQEHTGRLGEYLEVEQEIAKVRGDIEDLEAQQRRHAQRVRYGAVRVSLREEYAARFEIERTAISARLRSAVVEGLQGVIQQGAGTLSLILLFAPSMLFWVALLYLPVRFGWRRIRALLVARKATMAPVQP